MTVCIAALSHPINDVPYVIAMTDSMLTAGDIEFEPPQAKMFQFGTTIVGLAAGDASDQITICNRTYAALTHGKEHFVADVAAEYSRQLSIYRREQAEIAVLKPFDLTYKSFLSKQQRMDTDFLASLQHRLSNFEIECETIIAGTEGTSAGRIFVISGDGQIACNDSVAFAAIGFGGEHAESQFMFSRYTRQWAAADALYLAYAAKKRAEAAPSVGRDTYMYVIGAGAISWLNEGHLVRKELQSRYRSAQKQTRRIQSRSVKAFRAGMERIFKELQEKGKQPPTPPGATPGSEPPKEPPSGGPEPGPPPEPVLT